MDIFKKVFNGDERLVMTFWGWGFGGSIVFIILLSILAVILGIGNSLLVSLLELPWLAFIWVGIWRSSDKYKGASHWQLLAKAAVVIFALLFIYGLINPTPLPTL